MTRGWAGFRYSESQTHIQGVECRHNREDLVTVQSLNPGTPEPLHSLSKGQGLTRCCFFCACSSIFCFMLSFRCCLGSFSTSFLTCREWLGQGTASHSLTPGPGTPKSRLSLLSTAHPLLQATLTGGTSCTFLTADSRLPWGRQVLFVLLGIHSPSDDSTSASFRAAFLNPFFHYCPLRIPFRHLVPNHPLPPKNMNPTDILSTSYTIIILKLFLTRLVVVSP